MKLATMILAVTLVAGCSSIPFLKGASSKAVESAVPGGSLVTSAVRAAAKPKPETRFKQIHDLVTDAADEADASYDYREQLEGSPISSECIQYRRLVAEGRIADIVEEFYCPPKR